MSTDQSVATRTRGTIRASAGAVFPLSPDARARSAHVRSLVTLFLVGLASAACSEGFTSSSGDGDGDGSGGATSSGGSPSTGGSTMGLDCPPGEVIFNIDSSAPDLNCLPGPGCGPIWLNILDSTGEPVIKEAPCGLGCNDCSAMGCLEASACEQVPFDRQISYAWHGTEWAGSTCGDGSECAELVCVAPGKYTPEICLERALPAPEGSDECTPAGTLQCTKLPPFDWPSSQIITATLGGAP